MDSERQSLKGGRMMRKANLKRFQQRLSAKNSIENMELMAPSYELTGEAADEIDRAIQYFEVKCSSEAEEKVVIFQLWPIRSNIAVREGPEEE
ncbi:MAG: hypothetical protein D6730_08380 [Bacteroidetes bacterium]|nr:MAG: hypothetical protein D6730_08380 [Bacteroidota bacterium]